MPHSVLQAFATDLISFSIRKGGGLADCIIVLRFLVDAEKVTENQSKEISMRVYRMMDLAGIEVLLSSMRTYRK